MGSTASSHGASAHYAAAADAYGDGDIFGTPPSILDALSDGECSERGSLDDSMWLIDEARHLLDTFGGRAVRDWHRCGRDGCDDVGCICHIVREGIHHYGAWGDSIATILTSVATMADDEAVEDPVPHPTQQTVEHCCDACDRDGVCERL